MSGRTEPSRVVPAVHALKTVEADPEFERGLSENLRQSYGRDALVEVYARFAQGEGKLDTMMRRAIWRALARRFGNGVSVGPGVGFRHAETFEIGNGVFIGANTYIQGRYDGCCSIGDFVVDRAAELPRRPQSDPRRVCGMGARGEGPRLRAHRDAAGCADHPDGPRGPAGESGGVGRYRDGRDDPAGRDGGKGEHSGCRRGGDARRSAVFDCRRRACTAHPAPGRGGCEGFGRGGAMPFSRALITGGAGLIGSHIADALVRERRGTDRDSRQFRAGRRENLRWAAAERARRDRRGRYPRPATGSRTDARRRRGFPPGGYPHHAVRRGSAARLRCAGGGHVQRVRGRGECGSSQGGGRLVGVRIRPGR